MPLVAPLSWLPLLGGDQRWSCLFVITGLQGSSPLGWATGCMNLVMLLADGADFDDPVNLGETLD